VCLLCAFRRPVISASAARIPPGLISSGSNRSLSIPVLQLPDEFLQERLGFLEFRQSFMREKVHVDFIAADLDWKARRWLLMNWHPKTYKDR
jgi:hypothetical protein